MKPLHLLLATALAVLSTGVAADPEPGGTCRAKHEAITRDIERAKADGQKQRVRGLERALKQVNRNCSDAKLLAEHQRRIQRQEKKVAEHEREVKAAEREGDIDKVARRKSKLLDEQAELQRLKDARLN